MVKHCPVCDYPFDALGARKFCTYCLPGPGVVGAAEYQRRRRALGVSTSHTEYSRSYYRALRALASKYPYEFALLLEDIRATERRGHEPQPAEPADR